MRANHRYRDYQDGELVSLLNDSDHLAFTEIYNRYSSVLYQQTYRILRDTDICHDIVQDVFLSVWHKRYELQINTSLSSYLFKSVRNRVLNRISHQRVMEKYVHEIQDFSKQCAHAPDAYFLEKELLHIIETEKARLPPRTRQLYELNREQYMTYKEIGEQLNISEKTVKKQVFNALRVIRLRISSVAHFLSVLFAFYFMPQ